MSFEKDQEEKSSFLPQQTALRLAAATEATPVFPTVQPPSPQTAGHEESEGSFIYFPFFSSKVIFLKKTVQLVTIGELWLPRGLDVSKHEGICVAIKHATFPNQYIFFN